MDALYQESLKKIDAVLAQHPELTDVAKKLREGSELKNILEFEGVGVDILPTVEFETLLVIALFIPISELGDNIAESANIPKDVAKRIALMVETLILEPIADALRVYDIEMRTGDDPAVPDANIALKEKLELRPSAPAQTGAQATVPSYGTSSPVPPPPRSAIPPPIAQSMPTQRPVTLSPQSGPGTPPSQGGVQGGSGIPPSAGGTQSRPLTREELMNALGAKRTMASDMERARGGGAKVPPPSYGTPPPSSSVPPPPPSGH